jgi:hypothetical protein
MEQFQRDRLDSLFPHFSFPTCVTWRYAKKANEECLLLSPS